MLGYIGSRLYMLKKKNRELKSAIIYFHPIHGPNSREKYENMLRLKATTDRKIYARYLRAMMQTDTKECSLELMQELYKGIRKSDLMTFKEMIAYIKLPKTIEIWRGSQNYNEVQPRMSWSIDKSQTARYATAHRFRATINKKDIIAYYASDDELEVVAYIPEGKYIKEY